MKKFVLIPDSFKGTLTSSRVCDIISECILERHPDAEIIKIPVADGGEGSVDAFLEAVGGEKVYTECTGPFFERIRGFYGLINDSKCAVIEMAACAGLPLAGSRKNPLLTTTFGVGELINDALDRKVTKIIVGLGGSATNDGGCGCAAALGVKFFNEDGLEFIPVGGTLEKIRRIDMAGLKPELKDVEIVAMCDIDNPLYTEEGAAWVFAPQKGANPEQVIMLDKGLRNLAAVVKSDIGFDGWNFPGAGAAGGMGFGMKAFVGSGIQMGIETVLNTVHFEEIIAGADYVITGEGRLDSQSLRGKVVIGVSRRSVKHGIRVIAVVGSTGEGYEGAYGEGVTKIVVTNYLGLPFEKVKPRAESDMRTVVRELMSHI